MNSSRTGPPAHVALLSEAPPDPDLVRRMVHAGIRIARISCAHDGREEWDRMIGHLGQAGGEQCLVAMDSPSPRFEPDPSPQAGRWSRCGPPPSRGRVCFGDGKITGTIVSLHPWDLQAWAVEI